MNINDNSDENFFSHIDESLSDFFDIELDDKELEAAYPIQNEIKKLSEHYEILGEIDQGGMKKIFRAKDLKAERIVALAQLKRETKQETIEQFLREARLTASLQHPNIITIYDIGIDEKNSPFFTMELLEGQTLKSFIENKASQEFNIDVFLKICDAIAFAHSHSILHLDLKPENVYVGSFGQVTVCDWGIARILKQDEEAEISPQFDPDILNHMTLQGQIKGTPGFMAPEQATSNQQKDQRTDIYALGGILYFMFSKKAPIQGKEITTLIEKSKRAEIHPLDNHLSLPRALKAILTKCLSPEPQHRYASIIDLKLDIIKYQKGFATIAEDAGLLVHLQLLIRRQYKALVIIMFILALITLMGTQSLQRIRQERNIALKAEQVAQEERIKAEENLTNLKEAHLQNKLLTEDILELTNEIADSEDLSSAKRKIALLNESLKKEPKKKKKEKILRKKALLHFVIQEFNQASQTFAQITQYKNLSKFNDISDWAKNLKSDDQVLNDSQLAEVFSKCSNNQYELLKAMYYKHIQFKSKEAKVDPIGSIKLAQIMTYYNNNIWDKNRHKLNHNDFLDHKKLLLKGLPVSRFIIEPYKLNLLATLDFDYLDLSNTSFFEFIQLKGLQFKTLNISGCRMNEITPVRIKMLKNSGIQHIIYKEDLLTITEIELLVKNFEITVENK